MVTLQVEVKCQQPKYLKKYTYFTRTDEKNAIYHCDASLETTLKQQYGY